MSRVGLKPIPIPAGVAVELEAGNVVSCRGPQGATLVRRLHPDMQVVVEGDTILIRRPSDLKRHRALHGLTRSLVANMVTGVIQGFEKRLEVYGMGYRSEVQGQELVMQIGFSHPCRIPIPEGIGIEVQGNNITVRGADKELVGQIAANIKKLRKMSVYRAGGTDMRGIRYAGEQIRFKTAKSGKVGG
jgi:large subunit ribosomal protein L6